MPTPSISFNAPLKTPIKTLGTGRGRKKLRKQNVRGGKRHASRYQ